MSEVKIKIEVPMSVMLLPNGNVCCFDGNENQIGQLNKSWIVVWLESLEEKGINPMSVGRIETVINGKLVRIKPFKKEEGWGYSAHTLDLYGAWKYDRQIELNKGYSLVGFDEQDEMDSWIRNYMNGDTPILFFSEGCAFKGSADKCKPKEEWMERNGSMDSGGYWYRSYDGEVYSKNHYGWAFESALKVIGNPKYIIVLDKSKINK